jgi:hypothetical protein
VNLDGAVLPIAALDAATRAEMRTLLERFFDGVCADAFEADLAEKDQVVLLRASGGRLLGFSTVKVYRSVACGALRRVLFSGDTVVAPEAWRSPVAVRTWLRAVLKFSKEAPEPLDWFLLSSGHRTFRIMTTVFREHYPDPGRDRADVRERLHAYARERYGERFDAGGGVVRLERSVHRLRPGVGEVTTARLTDPAVTLFVDRNPGHAQGDELACLCEIADANLTAAGRRFLAGR